MTIDNTLKKEYEFFLQKKQELISSGKLNHFVLVKNQSIIDVFSTEREAFEAGVHKFGTDLFLVQKISENDKPESIQFLFRPNVAF